MINLRQINFRQPKYIFPMVIAVPLVALIYFVAEIFVGNEQVEESTDHINMNLPEAKNLNDYDKLRSMENRYEKDDQNFTVVDGFDNDASGREKLNEDGYTDEELDKLMAEAEEKQQEQQLAEMQRKLRESTARMRNGGYPGSSSYSPSESDVQRQLADVQTRSEERLRRIYSEPDPDEEERAERNRLAREQAETEKENTPSEVIKASELVHSKFNTIESRGNSSDSPLIKAMIDKTTKSTDGTRLRFKLLDDVVIDDVKLLKGTYLYGTVTGFGTQRVKANITSILVGSRFLKVDLSVYDIDGMEGFYVPASSFRDFMQDATASVAGQNINFSNSSTTGNGINPEMLALQALQNIYQAGAGAISKNIKKNKAKIKYNTIVYLINSKNIK